MLSHLYEFDGKPLQSVAKGGVDLGKLQDEAEKKAAEEAAESFKPVLERLKTALKDRAKDVRTTTRLVDSPACSRTWLRSCSTRPCWPRVGSSKTRRPTCSASTACSWLDAAG